MGQLSKSETQLTMELLSLFGKRSLQGFMHSKKATELGISAFFGFLIWKGENLSAIYLLKYLLNLSLTKRDLFWKKGKWNRPWS